MNSSHIPSIGILALVPEAYDVPWMSRHQILTRLAAYYQVEWVGPTPDWREMLRTPPRESLSRESVKTEGTSAFSVYTAPRWLPRVHRPAFLERALDRARLRAARKRLLERGCQTIVLYVWRPVYAPALDRVQHDVSLYHVVDEYSFSEHETEISDNELALLTRSDRVLIHSSGLFEKKGHLNPRTGRLPNGVDYEGVCTPSSEPSDLASIRHPRIGYCGWLKRQLDWKLIERLALKHPEWSFVFVGGVAAHPELEAIVAKLTKFENVHFLGAKSPRELIQYPSHFDACIMPYRMTAYTQHIYPLKLHEYLASGRSVVATPIRTLLDFQEVIALATTDDEWSDALSRALSPEAQSAEQRAHRQAVAQRHDWNRIAYQVAHLIAEAMGGEALQRLEAAPVPEAWRTPPPGTQRA
jgi:glycosyltransferase involved in cell wall biosynthesis